MSFSDRPSIARRIVDFHRDDEDHWVADLECGHGQHVRHDPPLISRPWVLTEAGRDTMVGTELGCVRCAEGEISLQPVLRGRLLELRPLRLDDFDALFAVASDPLIWEQHPARDRYQPEVFRAFFDEAMASGGALIATDAKDGHVIGASRYHGYDAESSEIEIGWTFLARRYWGGTYNGEMKQLMLRHAFTFVDRVVFLIGPENYRSQRAVEKIGAVRIGNRIDGYGRERLAFELTRPMFEQRQ